MQALDALHINNKLKQRHEKVNYMVFDDNNGTHFQRTAICANHVYGKHDKDAQRAVQRNGEAKPVLRHNHPRTGRDKALPGRRYERVVIDLRLQEFEIGQIRVIAQRSRRP